MKSAPTAKRGFSYYNMPLMGKTSEIERTDSEKRMTANMQMLKRLA
jgi:uncharacterized protein YcaQ